MSMRMSECVGMRVSDTEGEGVCVCVCVCVREREGGGREGGREGGEDREGESETGFAEAASSPNILNSWTRPPVGGSRLN